MAMNASLRTFVGGGVDKQPTSECSSNVVGVPTSFWKKVSLVYGRLGLSLRVIWAYRELVFLPLFEQKEIGLM